MSPWNLIGTPGYAAGVSGTVTLPADAMVLQIISHSSVAGGTVAILGGAAIPVISGAPSLIIDFKHRLYSASGSGASAQIVFTNTDQYFVHWVRQANL